MGASFKIKAYCLHNKLKSTVCSSQIYVIDSFLVLVQILAMKALTYFSFIFQDKFETLAGKVQQNLYIHDEITSAQLKVFLKAIQLHANFQRKHLWLDDSIIFKTFGQVDNKVTAKGTSNQHLSYYNYCLHHVALKALSKINVRQLRCEECHVIIFLVTQWKITDFLSISLFVFVSGLKLTNFCRHNPAQSVILSECSQTESKLQQYSP